MDNNEVKSYEEPQSNNSIFTEDDFSIGIYDKHIRQARNAIFAAAGVLVLNLIILAATVPAGYDLLWIDLLIWGAFIGGFIALGIWTKSKPYYAIICALILYALFIALNAVLDLSTIYKGILFKIFIIVFLVKALSDAKAAQDMKRIT